LEEPQTELRLPTRGGRMLVGSYIPFVQISFTSSFVFGILRRGVLVDVFHASIVDADDNQRLDLSRGDQRLRDFIDAPFLARNKRSGAVEQILPSCR